jgi:hypothetical protein
MLNDRDSLVYMLGYKVVVAVAVVDIYNIEICYALYLQNIGRRMMVVLGITSIGV